MPGGKPPLVFTKRQFPEVVTREAMSLIEVGQSPFCRELESVLCDDAGSTAGTGGIVDGL